MLTFKIFLSGEMFTCHNCPIYYLCLYIIFELIVVFPSFCFSLELPANSDAHFLVGFANRGQKDFIIETMDASFRYAMDFNFHIQNVC